jgi:hypothetical protein
MLLVLLLMISILRIPKSCIYLAAKFYPEHKNTDKLLSTHALCLCDDDNDLEMAIACRHAYIPEVSSSSMAKVIEANQGHFTQTGWSAGKDAGTAASEAALALILEKVSSKK